MDKGEHLSYLYHQQNRRQSELSSSKQKISEINEKLERLRRAKKSVDEIHQEMKQLRKETYAIRDQEEWKGSEKEKFVKEMEEFNSHFEQYIRDIDNYYDEICNKITRLENEKMTEESVLGGIVSLLNSIGNEIGKLMHS